MFRLKNHKSDALSTQAFGPRVGFDHRGRTSLTTIEARRRSLSLGNHLLLLLMMLLTWATKSTGQTLQKPNVDYPAFPCELRNEHRVFLQAPLSTRQQILKELEKDDGIVLAESPEEADYFLIFTYSAGTDGVGANFTGETGVAAGYAEFVAVKYVQSGKDQVRPRILFYWQGKKTSRSLPLSLNGVAANVPSLPRTTRSAIEGLFGRIFGWAISKKWPNTFAFDQFTGQLTISTGGKFETSGAKAFIKALKNARGDSYAQKCATPLPPPTLLVERPRVRSLSQSRLHVGGTRRHSLKHTRKRRSNR